MTIRTEFQRYEFRLFDQIERLHMSINGSGDDLSMEDMESIVNFIKFRLSSWDSSQGGCEVYDSTVRSLCNAVVWEFGVYSSRMEKM